VNSITNLGPFCDEKLKAHLSGSTPEDLKISSNDTHTICWAFSQLDRTAIVLNIGENLKKIEVLAIGQKMLNDFS